MIFRDNVYQNYDFKNEKLLEHNQIIENKSLQIDKIAAIESRGFVFGDISVSYILKKIVL